MTLTNMQNAKILCEFVTLDYREQNLKLSSRQSHIKILCLFERFMHHKDFRSVSKNDILDYLNSLKRMDNKILHINGLELIIRDRHNQNN